MTAAWPEVALGETCAFQNGGTPSKKVPAYFGGDIPWLTGADIEGPSAGACRTFLTDAGIEASPACVVPEGTILLVTRTGVGKVAIANRTLSFSQDITALTPNPTQLDRKYLLRFLQTEAGRFKAESRGATIKGITREVVASTKIPLPPLDEQRRIAAILDKADEVRSKRKAALATLETLSQAIFIEMFGDPVTNPMGWERTSLRQLTDVITKGTTPTSVGLDFAEDGVPFLRVQDLMNPVINGSSSSKYVTPEVHEELKRSRIEPGDVLLSIAGTIGRCAVVHDSAPPMNCNQAVAIIRPGTSLSPHYLASWLRSGDALRQVTSGKVTATISNLSLGQVSGLKLPMPTEGLQEIFEKQLVAASESLRLAQLASDEFDELFASIQQKAFQGTL